jgi:presqualene diphosphate synthase
VRLYGRQYRDFLAIIDGMEMDARTDIPAPTLIDLDLYCERVAVAVGRLSVRIFGEETPAGERVAAELGRRGGYRRLPASPGAPARRHARDLPRAPPRAARAQPAAP